MIDLTPLLRLYANRRHASLAAEDPVASQRRQLFALLRRAQETRFGKEHGFAHIRDVADFQRQVPLRSYEDFWADYWRKPFPFHENLTWPGKIPYFATTSGTTAGRTKYIPVSHEMVSANRHAALDILTHHLAANPGSTVLAGKGFMLGGSTSLLREGAGVHSGDLSGISAKEVPWWARLRFFPSAREAFIADWEKKVDKLARLSLAEDIRSLAGTPSWVLLFFAKLAALRPDKPRRAASYYPELELLIHGGVNFAPYRRQFEELLAGGHAEMREVYPASEGFIAIADRGWGDGLRLITDGGIFHEFVPVEEVGTPHPARHWAGTLERDINYAVILTSCAGLWSYMLGDTVRFVGTSPPRLLITGRLSYSLSAFGEHLTEEQIEAAVTAGAARIGCDVVDFTVTPVFPRQPGERGHHLYIVEFSEPAGENRLRSFGRLLDQDLALRNEDYRQYRSGDFGMTPPVIREAKPGSFAAWMKARGKAGGQNKVPRVIQDPAFFHFLEDFLEQARS